MPSAFPLGRRLRFQQLELVTLLIDAGNLGAAAEQLHVTRAALSKSLRELEAALGAQLFLRSASGMTPTAAGLRMARHARRLLNELQQMRHEVNAEPGASVTRLRLGMPPFVATHVAPTTLRRLRARAPHGTLNVQVHEGRLHRLIEQLLRSELDAVLALYAPQAVAGLDIRSLAIEHCTPVPMEVVAAPTIRLPRGARHGWAGLAEQPWILPHPGTHLRTAVDQMFSAVGRVPPLPCIESSAMDANVKFAAAGLGLAVVPRTAAATEIAEGRLRVLRMQQPLPATELVLMYRKLATLYVDALDPLIQVMREQPGPDPV